jgi:simple sugar transport system permease protein
MTAGAMTGAVAAVAGHGAPLALFYGTVAGLLVGLPFILAVVVFGAPMISPGLALVAIGPGVSGAPGRGAAHKTFDGLAPLDLPGALTGLPIFGKMLFAQDPVVYPAIVIAAPASYVLFRTRAGLQLRAVGEDPATADAAGVDVQLHQPADCIVGCALIGLAGAYLSVAVSQTWTEGMVAGRGWIALALVVFAQWSPLRAIAGAAVFAGADVLITRLQTLGLDVPIYLMSTLPYVLTISVLVVLAVLGKDRQGEPGFLGRAYVRQDR